MKPRVLTILGTRPEVIKLAPVILALRGRPGLDSVVCSTAQHREMLDLALAVFEVTADIDLDLMRPNQQLHELTSRVLIGVTDVLRKVRPDLVLVQGDTTTALASALAAFYERIPVGHVEAGLRTGDLARPFPEEMNRKVIGSFSTLHFAPTPRARDALLREGVAPARVLVTGNTVIDALHMTISAHVGRNEQPFRRRILVTAHRRESFGKPFESLCLALRDIAERFSDIEILFPVHPNPNVMEPTHRLLGGLPNVLLRPPLEYVDFVLAMQGSTVILTDSGGVQEEAVGLGKPVLVMRETSDRPESIEVGAARLVGTDREQIVQWCARLLNDSGVYAAMSTGTNPYGDGHASERIVDAIERYLAGTLNISSMGSVHQHPEHFLS